MISPEDTYPGRTVPASASYPEGSIKNETVPNSSDDGTPLDELWGNDFEGLKQAIARLAGIVPTPPGNVPDTATASQVLQGLIELAQGRATNYDETGVADAYILTAQTNQQAPASLFDGQRFIFTAGNTNTGLSDIDLLGLGGGVKDIINTASAGTIIAGNRYEAEYRSGTDDVEILNLAAAGAQEIRSITATVAVNALTLGLDATTLEFRDSAIGSGTVNSRDAGTISLVVPSGATLGTVSNVQSRLILLAIDNAGAIELAIVNLAGGNNLDETTLITTIAIDGTADSDNVFYSTTARANVPFRVIGFIESTQVTAGLWAAAPSTIQGEGGNALTAMSSLGYGQTWQLPSRAFGTTYYNTTGKPITVIVSSIKAASGTINATVDGVTLPRQGSTSSAHTEWPEITFIVPPNQSYAVTVTSGTLDGWAELR